jgi:hypothetical protein
MGARDKEIKPSMLSDQQTTATNNTHCSLKVSIYTTATSHPSNNEIQNFSMDNLRRFYHSEKTVFIGLRGGSLGIHAIKFATAIGATNANYRVGAVTAGSIRFDWRTLHVVVEWFGARPP